MSRLGHPRRIRFDAVGDQSAGALRLLARHVSGMHQVWGRRSVRVAMGSLAVVAALGLGTDIPDIPDNR